MIANKGPESISVGAIGDLNGTHGTEFSSEWVKDKDKWRKFYNKNRDYLLSLKKLAESGQYVCHVLFEEQENT